MKRAILSLRVQHKILLCFVFVALVTILLLQVPIFIAQEAIIQKSVAQSQATIKQFSLNVEHYILMISEKLSVLASDLYVQEQLKRDKKLSSGKTGILQNDTMSKIMVQTFYSPFMRDMDIYTSKGNVYYIVSAKSGDLEYSEYIETAIKAKGKIIIINNNEYDDLQIVKAINDTTTIEYLGVLRVGIKKSALVEEAKSLQLETGIDVIILDNNNKGIVGNGSNLDSNSLADMSDESGILRCKYNEIDSYMVYQRSSYGWLTVGIVPVNLYTNSVKHIRTLQAVLGAAIIMCCFILSLLLKFNIVNPIKEMLNVVNHVGDGNFSVLLKSGDRSDEIGELSSGINTMVTKLDKLITDVYHSELLQKESEFKALQAQINPHFLYNTLDTINWLAKKEGLDNICSMVQAVGNLMRISISSKKNTNTVQE